jgi:hypothetical protein
MMNSESGFLYFGGVILVYIFMSFVTAFVAHSGGPGKEELV